MSKIIDIGPAEISKAVGDAEFFKQMPEFAVLKVKMETMKANSTRGCTPCRKRREVASINADFMRLLPTLSDDGKARLKKYYGADQIKYNTIDRVARKTYVVTI